MAFPQHLLEEIKAKVRLSSLVGQHVKLLRRGHEYSGLCPFHKEKTPSFTVSDDKGFYHCFGCQAHGSIFDFLMTIEGLTFPESVERLAAKAGVNLPVRGAGSQVENHHQRQLYRLLEAATEWFGQQLWHSTGYGARQYLRERGLVEATIKQFGLGFAPNSRMGLKEALLANDFSEDELLAAGLLIKPEDDRSSFDRFRNRLIFPITDSKGRPIAFGGRALGNTGAKYINSPETTMFVKGQTLYHLHEARKAIREVGGLVVVEGYMDVIAMASAGIENVVAPLGTAVTEAQIATLWNFTREPVMCFDGDTAGRNAAMSLAERVLPFLKPDLSLRFVLLPEGEDPDSLIRGQGVSSIKSSIEKALPLSDLIWWKEVTAQPIDSPEREAGFYNRLQLVVNKIKDTAVKGAYSNLFRNRFQHEFRSKEVNRRKAYASMPQAFVKASNSQQGGGFRRFPNERVAPSSPSLRQSALVHGDDRAARENFLVAAVLSQPHLLGRGEEAFARAKMRNQNLDTLRAGILKAAAAGATESQGLMSCLASDGLGELADRLVEVVGKTYPRLHDVSAGQEIERAWQNALALHNRSSLKEEIESAWVDFANQSSDATKGRLVRLQEELGGTQGIRTKGNLISES